MPRPYKGTWEECAQRRAEIVRLYSLGWSAPKVAKEVGLTKSTVYYHLHVAGKKRRRRSAGRSKLSMTSHREIERTIKLYADGLTTREVGDILGITHSTVRYRLIHAGIDLRPAVKRKGANGSNHHTG